MTSIPNKSSAPHLLSVGDRVVLSKQTKVDERGIEGVVKAKFMPAHSCAAWRLVVRWDSNSWDTSYPYSSISFIQRSNSSAKHNNAHAPSIFTPIGRPLEPLRFSGAEKPYSLGDSSL